MKKLAIIIGAVITFMTLTFLGIGFYVISEEENQLKEIERLAGEGEYEKSFNLAQDLIEGNPETPLKNASFYWQAFCLYKKNDAVGAMNKLRELFEDNPDFERMAQDEGFQKIYWEIKAGKRSP